MIMETLFNAKYAKIYSHIFHTLSTAGLVNHWSIGPGENAIQSYFAGSHLHNEEMAIFIDFRS